MKTRAMTFIVSLAAVLCSWQASARIEGSFLQRSRKFKDCSAQSQGCYQAAEKLLEDYQASRARGKDDQDRYSFLKGHRTDQVVLLVHSFMMRPSELYFLGEQAAHRDMNVFPILLEGHGTRSIRFGGTVSLSDVTAEDWLADMEFGINLAHGFGRKVYVMGYSLGGLLGLLQGISDHPLIDGVIAVAPPLAIEPSIWMQRFEFAGGWLAKSDYLSSLIIKNMTGVEDGPIQLFVREYARGMHQVFRLGELINPYVKHAAYVNFRKSEKAFPVYLQKESFRRMKIPSVIVASPHDNVVDFKAINRFTHCTSAPSLLIEDQAINHIDYDLRLTSKSRRNEYEQALEFVLGKSLQAEQ